MEIFSINNIIGALINSFAYIFIWSRLLNKKINFKSYKYYVVQVLFAFLMLLNFLFINTIFRVLVIVVIMTIFCYFLFKCNYRISFITSIFSQLTMMISELIFAILAVVVLKIDSNFIVSNLVGKLIANTFISIIAIMACNIKIIQNLYNKIVSSITEIKINSFVIIILATIITINFNFLSVYYHYPLLSIIIGNIAISVIYIFIYYKYLIAETNYSKINDKYNNTLNSLKEYEEILDVYRVSNHENKNQLLMIRNMIIKKEKDIPEYIDKIIDNKIKDDEKLMFDTNKIPAGGLRAVIYSKLLVMKDEKIDFNLIVDRKVRTVDLIELGESLMFDVCRITGVFLDNAIEEVKNKEDKRIFIELFTDEDKLCIKISNNFKGSINIEKIYEKGYTTKSEGHGYGLALVKEIVDKNSKLTNLTSVENDIFTQLLEIKVK